MSDAADDNPRHVFGHFRLSFGDGRKRQVIRVTRWGVPVDDGADDCYGSSDYPPELPVCEADDEVD